MTRPDLRYLHLTPIEDKACELVDDSKSEFHLCVYGVKGKAPCRGDSGGPLVTLDTKEQIGINSFGSNNCGFGGPRAFTKVSECLDWIKNITGLNA